MFPAALLQLLLILAVVGVLLWAITQIPMDAVIIRLIRVVIIVVVALWLIYWLFGLIPPGGFPLRHG